MYLIGFHLSLFFLVHLTLFSTKDKIRVLSFVEKLNDGCSLVREKLRRNVVVVEWYVLGKGGDVLVSFKILTESSQILEGVCERREDI